MGWLKRLTGPSPGEMVERALGDVVVGQPLEGTNMSLFQSIIPDWWAANIGGTGVLPMGTPELADKVWVANRCIQMNAQQIASMPLLYHGADEPAWISSPDPNWYPNGVGDALHSIVSQLYGWGFCCLYVTDTYADGFPRTWTVLNSAGVNITAEEGFREYKYGEKLLNPARVVQIDRNPGTALHGTSAISAYAQTAWGLTAAGNQSMSVSQGGIPTAVLKPQKKITAEQAANLQAQWMAAVTARNGAPPVLPPDLDFEVLSFSPADLSLLETQEWTSRVLATAFGVPAVLLNMSLQGGLTYQNPAALGEMWWRFELRTTATRIANAFTAQMLPRGSWVSFDAADTFAEITSLDDDDDEQGSQVAKASPAQQPAFSNGNGASPPVGRMVHFEEGAISVAPAPPASVIVRPPNVQVDVHNGSSTRTVTFSDGTTATIEEGATANVD